MVKNYSLCPCYRCDFEGLESHHSLSTFIEAGGHGALPANSAAIPSRSPVKRYLALEGGAQATSNRAGHMFRPAAV